jgi:hypothetical protein
MSRSITSTASLLALAAALASPGLAQAADPISILFVGNSYTFGRVDPVMGYNAANVHDLTAAMNVANSSGSNPYEPHPWGGVPGIFQAFTAQAGLNYDVSISARNAASIRGHFLNTNPAGWDMQGNLASKKWDNVVLQGLSDEALPAGRGANANLAGFGFYANQIENYVHNGISAGPDVAGTSINVTETQLWGSTAACQAGTGNTANTCNNTLRNIKANPNENAAANVYLYETWARPDMIYPHTRTVTDPVTGAITLGVGAATTYYNDNPTLEAMTADLRNGYFGVAAANPRIKGVAPVGDAFLRAVQEGVATRNPYAGDAFTDGLVDLWWDDNLHASKYGSYLSALTLFGTITGVDPATLGAGERAAQDLGIASADALALQRIASLQLGFTSAVPEPGAGLLMLAGVAALLLRRRSRAPGAGR